MNKRKVRPSLKALAPQCSLKDYVGTDLFEKAGELYDLINVPVFKRNAMGISNRNFQWWGQEGVLSEVRNEAGRLTFIEFVWLRIVEHLRMFGVPLPTIAHLKTKLLDRIKFRQAKGKESEAASYIEKLQISKEEKRKLLELIPPGSDLSKEQSEVSILALFIMECVLKKKKLAIAIFANGDFLVIDKEKQNLMRAKDQELLEYSHYIKISISSIISDFMNSDLALKALPEILLVANMDK